LLFKSEKRLANIKRYITIIVLIGIAIGLYLIIDSNDSDNLIITWILVVIWVFFTISWINRIKRIRDFNSPHDSAYLTLGSLMIYVYYGIWGNYTAILQESLWNLFDYGINIWTTLFSFPYFLYSLFGLSKCFRKFSSVYIGTHPLNSKKFAIFSIILLWTIIIGSFLYIDGYFSIPYVSITLYSTEMNMFLIITGIFAIILILIIATLGKNNTSYSTNNTERRRTRINNQIQDADRLSNKTREAEQNALRRKRKKEKVKRTQREIDERARNRRAKESKEQEERRKRERATQLRRDGLRRKREKEQKEKRRKPQSTTRKNQQNRRNQQSSSKVAPTSTTKSKKKKVDADKQKRYFLSLRPKTGTVEQNDFQCIFCFDLPKTGDEKTHKGIIVCPQCKYPSHADEFFEWVLASDLCSRCGSEIPRSFRNNPKVISIKNYLAAMKYLIKHKK
jgi:hypothetical protein